MHPLKKYFNEGLIQVAIFLSLAGIHVDLDSYLPQPHDIKVQSSAQTLSDLGNSRCTYTHPTKNTNMDASVSNTRMLCWLRSLDYLNIPVVQLDAWLVHSETDNSRITVPSLVDAHDGEDDMEDSGGLTLRMGDEEPEESGYNTVMDESLDTVASLFRNQTDGEDNKEEIDQTSIWQQDLNQHVHQQLSQEHHHLNLFNEDKDDFMVTSWQQGTPDNQMPVDVQRADPGSDRHDDLLQHYTSLLSPMLHQPVPFLELEQQWQDVLAITGPQDLHMDDPLDRSHFIARGTVRETGTMENCSKSNIHQTTSSRSSQLSQTQTTINKHLPDQNQTSLHLLNSSNTDLSLNYSDIMDFLLFPAPDSSIDYHHSLPNSPMEEQSLLTSFCPHLDEAMFDENLLDLGLEEGFSQSQLSQNDELEYRDTDSGLSLDFNQSPVSPNGSEASCSSSSFSSISSTESVPKEGAIGYTNIKEELTDEGAVGGYTSDNNKMCYTNYLPIGEYQHLPWLEHIGHDHTYNQPQYTSRRNPSKQNSVKCLKLNFQDNFINKDDKRAQVMKIPFPNDHIINLPVEEFNKVLAKHRLSEAQLLLIRDIRRRGKNKVAAQHCRQRKLDTMFDLERNVADLCQHRARLLREKSEILRSVRELKQRIKDLHQEVWSRRREMQGISCSDSDFPLQQGHVTKSRRKSGKKQKEKD